MPLRYGLINFQEEYMSFPEKRYIPLLTKHTTFFEHLQKHGLPDIIVSDRDPKFTSAFWSHLMYLCCVKFNISTNAHPQTDGAPGIKNGMVEKFVLFYVCYNQNDWDESLPAAEFAYKFMRQQPYKYEPFGGIPGVGSNLTHRNIYW